MAKTHTPSASRRRSQIERGNIDLDKRPKIKNSDGSVSTVRSASFNIDGKEVLIPTVSDTKVLSDKEALIQYQKTGKHLGKFRTAEGATGYAQELHKDQEKQYVPKAPFLNPVSIKKK